MDEVFRLFPIPFMRAAFAVVRFPMSQRWLAPDRRPTLYGIGVRAAYWTWLRVAAVVF